MSKLRSFATNLLLNFWCHLAIWKLASIIQFYDDAANEELASYYKVSRPVILLKLVNRGIFTSEDYRQKTAQWTEEYESRLEGRAGGKSPGGGNYYNTHAVYLGYRFMELAFSRYHQGQCSIEELADHLNVKVKNLPRLEDCLLRKTTR